MQRLPDLQGEANSVGVETVLEQSTVYLAISLCSGNSLRYTGTKHPAPASAVARRSIAKRQRTIEILVAESLSRKSTKPRLTWVGSGSSDDNDDKLYQEKGQIHHRKLETH